MSNLLGMMTNMIRTGMQPEAVLNRIMQTGDPRIAQVRQMVEGKNQQQLYQMVCNMCKERGTTPEEVARSMGLPVRR